MWQAINEKREKSGNIASQACHSGGNISSIMHLRLANMLMWQAIKEERDDCSNIGRQCNIINVMFLCVMYGNK